MTGSGQDGAYILCIMFIGDQVGSCSFQVLYCDNKEILNVIRCTEYNSMLKEQHGYIITFVVGQS